MDCQVPSVAQSLCGYKTTALVAAVTMPSDVVDSVKAVAGICSNIGKIWCLSHHIKVQEAGVISRTLLLAKAWPGLNVHSSLPQLLPPPKTRETGRLPYSASAKPNQNSRFQMPHGQYVLC